jgi:UDP-N-acetylmuramoyl-L-alanyl-D-glutamate--2,6-diaminopimelate ligase
MTPTAQLWRLSDLLAGFASTPPRQNPEIHGLALDSRELQPGGLFLAVPGQDADGRSFIPQAVANGAVAVAYDASDDFTPPPVTVPLVAIQNLKHTVGHIADRFYGSPSRYLLVIGVTGTNGKTTCSHLLAQVLDRPDGRCGVIGTVGVGFPGALERATHSTPDALRVHALLAEFARQGATSVCMEVSSHALDQGRVQGVVFTVALFTNLTRDHLDYHGSMQAYGEAKARLFAWPGLKAAVINCDDAFGRDLIERARGHCAVTSYGLTQGEVHALEVNPSLQGLRLRVATAHGEVSLVSGLLGRFNAANLLAVLACLLACGRPLAESAARLAQARAPGGRMERFGHDRQPTVVVDYAHSPDALEKVLQALREHVQGRLWCVFGCGGDRDRGKRPQMGRIAEALADDVILTDDNPRSENPEAIINDIAAGMHKRPPVLRDRAAAIRAAVQQARPGDIVLIAGKGHEDYQQIGAQRLAYSDRRIVSELIGEVAA